MSSVYAIDPLPPSFTQHVLAAWEVFRDELPAAKLYALIDAGFSEEIRAEHLHGRQHTVSLYAGTHYDEMIAASPYLMRLPTERPEDLEHEVGLLVRRCSGLPMLSFVSSPLGLAELKSHFKPFITVHTIDGASYALRLADTCVQMPLLQVLTPVQRAALTPPGTRLLCPTRDARLIASLPVSMTCEAPLERLEFSDTQFVQLNDAMEADVILAQLGGEAPRRAVQGCRPSEVHAFVQEQIHRASAHGLHDTPDLVVYCAIALDHGPHFDEHPALQRALSGAKGQIASRLAGVPRAVWSEIEQRVPAAPGSTASTR